jgi:tetratricopeptide (TPR) repeat protein
MSARVSHGLLPLIEWMAAGREQAAPLVRDFLTLVPEAWDDWLAEHPEARTVPFFEGVLGAVENGAAPALGLTSFVLRHVASLEPPPTSGEIAHLLLWGSAWRVRGDVVRDAGDRHEAYAAYQSAAAIFRAEPAAREELEAVERAAAALRVEKTSVSGLLSGTAHSRLPELARHPELQNAGALAELSRLAMERLHRVPLEATAIAQLALEVANGLSSIAYPAVVLAQIRAQAWRDLGVALRHLARHQDALDAYASAARALEGHQWLELDRAAVSLARASTLMEINRFDESFAELLRCKPVFERYDDRRRLLLCGIYEGAFLHRTGRFREAIAAYLSLIEPSRAIGDLDALASIHNNIVHSAIELGEYELAEEHLDRAIALFMELDAPLNIARSELARGRMLIGRGEIERGIAHLHAVRDRFLQQRLVEEAGLAGLDIVDAYLSRGSIVEAEALAREIVREFIAAQLNARAITALGYLSEVIASRAASRAIVQNVREFIRKLRVEPDAEFAATA